MAQVRRVNVSYREKDRIAVTLDACIVVQPGVLSKDEVAILKTRLADKLMTALTDIPYVHAHLSELKVSR